MIKPLYENTTELLSKANNLLDELEVRRLKIQLAKEALEASQTEADSINDDELNELDLLQEDCPVCEYEQDIIDYINNFNYTRDVKFLTFHCTATRQDATVSAIVNYWKRKGWKNPGYSIIIKPDGSYTILADFNRVTNGVRNYNHNSIHISYIGGQHKDDRTDEQKRIMQTIAETFKERLPHLIVCGHRDFLTRGTSNWKDCPRFDAKKEYGNNN